MTNEQLKPLIGKKVKAVVEVDESGRRKTKRGTLRDMSENEYILISDSYNQKDFFTYYCAEQFVKCKEQVIR